MVKDDCVLEHRYISRKDIVKRIKKENLTIICFGCFLLLLGILLYWFAFIGLAILILGIVSWKKDLKKEFHVVLNPVNELDTGDYSTDGYDPDYIYFNYHGIYGRYKYQFSPNEKELYQAKKGDMYYLFFGEKPGGLFTSIICVFPADTTILDDELSQKLQSDKQLTGYPLEKGMELKQRIDSQENG